MEKIILAKKAGKFFVSPPAYDQQKRGAVLTVIRKLAADIDEQVREALAFELRVSHDLPADIAEKIACDVESVSLPFLEHTTSLTSAQLIKLLPKMSSGAHIVLAKRSDLSPELAHALAEKGEETTVTYVVRNTYAKLQEKTCHTIIQRFEHSTTMMAFLSQRDDLPLNIIADMIDLISDTYKHALLARYDMGPEIAKNIMKKAARNALWDKVKESTPQQIHGLVTDLKSQNRLSHNLVLEMAERGSFAFLESTLALYWGMTLLEVRTSLQQSDRNHFIVFMEKKGINKITAEKYAEIIQKKGFLEHHKA